jgi:competence protein ComEA
MVELPDRPSAEEREFWQPQFRDPPAPGRGSDHPPTRREGREGRYDRSFDGPLLRVADRLRDWRADARFGVAVLVGIALVAGVIWYRVGIGGASAGESGAPPAVATTAPGTTLPDVTGTTSARRASSATIAVHVAGAVTHPGVVELHEGSRVIDAVEAVGGALADADLDRLNLAAKVADGQRVYVVKVGQTDPGAVGSDPSGDGGAAGAGGDGVASGGKVNLNTATQAQLEELPGIGPTYAQSIIAERQRRGGFKSVNDLRSVRGIGDKRFAELAPLVTV